MTERNERPRRSTRSKKKRTEINPEFYLGYCEDFETPAMIMKKFEELAKIEDENKKRNEENLEKVNKKKNTKSAKCEMDSDDEDSDMDNNDKNNNNNNNCGLTEEQKRRLFKQTSTFTVSSVKHNNDIFYAKPIISTDGEFIMGYDEDTYLEDLEYMADYTMEDNMFLNNGDEAYYEDEFSSESDTNTSNKKRSRIGGYKRRRGGNNITGIDFGSALTDNIGCDFNAKKKRCYELEKFDIPNYPIPVSWMLTVKPYISQEQYNKSLIGYYYKETDILSFKENNYINDLNMDKDNGYLGILMEPPIDTNDDLFWDKKKGLFDMKTFKEKFTKELMLKLCPKGMLFIWTESQLIPHIFEIAEYWGFKFVEHASWVMKKPNNKIALMNKYGLCCSKKNLYLFRRISLNKKKEYEKIELRHQRTSDVHADFIRYHKETGQILNSDYQYKLIETLIPNSIKHIKNIIINKNKNNNNNINIDNNNNNNVKSKLLYLWAPKNEKRHGWTMVVDPKQMNMFINDFKERKNKVVSN